MNQKKFMLLVIILLVIASIVTIALKKPKLGLDLIGGSRLVLEAQTTSNVKVITPDVMDSLQFAIEKRVNALGVAETVVQKAGEKRLILLKFQTSVIQNRQNNFWETPLNWSSESKESVQIIR
jgi:preprotein translocase subunit SecD